MPLVQKGKMDTVDLQEFLLTVMNERSDKFEQRFELLDRAVIASDQAVRDAKIDITSTIALALQSTDKRFDVVMDAAAKAILKSEAAVEKRFDAVNEFRAQMGDMQTTLARKSEVDIRFDALDNKIDVMARVLQTNQGKESGATNTWATISAIVALVISFIGVFVGLIAFLAKS